MAPTLTATPQTAAHDGTPVARVLLVLTWPGIQTATIERLDPDGTWRSVRGADSIACLGSCVAWDHEAPLDQAVTYRATSPQGTGTVVTDSFARTASNGWGSADTGQAYTTNGGSASDYSVSSGKGRLSCGTVGSSRKTLLTLSGADFDAYGTFTCPVTPTGAPISAGFVFRFDTGGDYYMVGARWETDGTLSAIITGQVAGVFTTTLPTGLVPSAGANVFVRAQCVGSTFRVKAWIGSVEPATWTLTVTDNQVTASTVGARAILETGNTNTLPVVVTVDNITINSLAPLTVTSSAVTVPSGGAAWLSHPGHPKYAAATVVNDLQATLPGRAGVFQAIGAALPIAVTDVRGGARGSVTWQVETVAEYQRIRALVADGGVLLMRLPATWSGDTWYILPGDIVEDRFTRIATDGWRRYTMPYTRVDSPTGPADGPVGQTLGDLKATYATLNDLKATGKTVAGLAANIY